MKIIVTENVFPGHTPRADLEAEVRDRLRRGALACHIEERDGTFVIVTVRPGPDAPPSPSGAGAMAETDTTATKSLGRLSERFESNGDPGAIGEDRVGGPSYGTYQIATRPGTMLSFLAFLERSHTAFAGTLNAAGGNDAAARKAQAFVDAWKALARDPAFAAAQHGFIKATHYDAFIEGVKKRLGLDVDARSMALRNVAWSTAVQHGPNNNVFDNALPASPAAAMPDRDIIEAVYAERSKVEVYFRNSTDRVKESLKRRFAQELADALAMLT